MVRQPRGSLSSSNGRTPRRRRDRPGGRSRALLVPLTLALTAAVVLAGCASLDSLTVAEIPTGDLASGWSQDDDQTEQGEVQAGPFTVAAFTSLIYTHNVFPRGIAAVVTVSDVAFADVEGRILGEFQTVLDDRNVDRTPRRSGQVSVDGYQADYTLYDAVVDEDGARVDAMVIEYTYKCEDAGTVVGYLGVAATELAGPLGGTDMSTWDDVAGSNWRNDIRGMAVEVECRG